MSVPTHSNRLGPPSGVFGKRVEQSCERRQVERLGPHAVVEPGAGHGRTYHFRRVAGVGEVALERLAPVRERTPDEREELGPGPGRLVDIEPHHAGGDLRWRHERT